MPRKNKENFDAASTNKEKFIKDNYLVKEDMSQKASANKKNIAIAFMLFVLLALIVFVFYKTYFSSTKSQQTVELSQATATEYYSPTPEITLYPATPAPRTVLSKYDEYTEIYPDLVGWISIDNIKVDNPVVQSSDPLDPLKYLVKGPDEKESKYGAIFLDIRNSADASDRHTIIYGHNMKDGSMFGQLDMYLKKTFYDTHLIIRYDTLYQELEWEVYNVFKTTIDFYYIETYFTSDEDFVNLMMQCVYKSYYKNNEAVITPEDRILTLSTCTDGNNDDERLVLQARLITPLDDPSEQSVQSSPEN